LEPGGLVYSSVLDLIGWTPLVRLGRVESFFDVGGVELYAKLEMYNPGGSVKDRIALYMLRRAWEEGIITEGSVVIEPTSGNTGIGLAIVSTIMGLRLVVTMPTKMSVEKEAILRAYGAHVIRTPTGVPPEDPLSYYRVAEALRNLIWSIGGRVSDRELRDLVGYIQMLVREGKSRDIAKILESRPQPTPYAYIPNQYYNRYNPLAHYETTAREIWVQTRGSVDYVFAGMGTGGTITGIARYLKEQASKGVRVIGIDPEGSIYHLVKKGVPLKEAMERARPYLVEGIGEDILPDTIDLDLVDDIVVVGDEEAFSMARLLARLEGLLVGGSSGAALYGAIKYLKEKGVRRGVAVVVFPDTGRNYVSKIFSEEWLRRHGIETDYYRVLGGLR